MNKYSLILMLLVSCMVHADVPPKSQHEVEHLISFVSNTPCLIERNWISHNGREAIAHIQQKYDYFRDDIKTTEQFIEYSATKSTMTGKDYMVKCAGQSTLKTKDWLLQELHKYRAQRQSLVGRKKQ